MPYFRWKIFTWNRAFRHIENVEMNQTDFRLVPNHSENGKYNLISGWFYKIEKIFLCVRNERFMDECWRTIICTGASMFVYTQRNIFQILLNEPEIRLYFTIFRLICDNKRTVSVCCSKINRCMVNTIWFLVDLMRFLCVYRFLWKLFPN